MCLCDTSERRVGLSVVYMIVLACSIVSTPAHVPRLTKCYLQFEIATNKGQIPLLMNVLLTDIKSPHQTDKFTRSEGWECLGACSDLQYLRSRLALADGPNTSGHALHAGKTGRVHTILATDTAETMRVSGWAGGGRHGSG